MADSVFGKSKRRRLGRLRVDPCALTNVLIDYIKTIYRYMSRKKYHMLGFCTLVKRLDPTVLQTVPSGPEHYRGLFVE